MPRQGYGMLMRRLDCLLAAVVSCILTERYVNASAVLSIHGAFVLISHAERYVNVAAGLSTGAAVLLTDGTVR